jgi:hypothetical protein
VKIQLKNWWITNQCLEGNVYGHPNGKHHDGKFIITSKLIGKRNNLVVTQSGSEYELGEVDSNYEKAFPNAKELLFSQLKDV